MLKLNSKALGKRSNGRFLVNDDKQMKMSSNLIHLMLECMYNRRMYQQLRLSVIAFFLEIIMTIAVRV
jgi:hypothetical protein